MKIRIFIFAIFLFFISGSDALAHPGNTDSSGGHTCRTNCDDWGLQYGEYHSHNNTEKSNEGIYDEDVYDTLEHYYELSYQVGYDIGYEDYKNEIYYNEEPVDDNLQQIDVASYGKGYSKGYADAEEEKDDELEAIEDSSVDDSGEDTDGKPYAEEDYSDDDAYDEGHDEGHAAAKKETMYNENNFNLREDQQAIYSKGYRAGWIAGGGGTFFEQVWFDLFETYPYITFPLIVIGVVFLMAWVNRRKR